MEREQGESVARDEYCTRIVFEAAALNKFIFKLKEINKATALSIRNSRWVSELKNYSWDDYSVK